MSERRLRWRGGGSQQHELGHRTRQTHNVNPHKVCPIDACVFEHTYTESQTGSQMHEEK